MKSLESIARELHITKQAVNQALKRGLAKVWCNVAKLYPELNSFDRMQLVAQLCNITSSSDYPHFFYSFPPEIRREIIEEITTKTPQFKGLNVNDFMNRDFKKRDIPKHIEEEEESW